MKKLKCDFGNINLSILQTENSLLNEKEYDSAQSVLASYPRRIFVNMDSAGHEQKPDMQGFFNPRYLKPIIPSFRFSEELILIINNKGIFPSVTQDALAAADDHEIKKSVAADFSLLAELIPWIFQYKIGKVHVWVNHRDLLSGSHDEIMKSIRDLVVRKYFANVKPMVNIVFSTDSLDESMIPKILMLSSNTEADGISLHLKGSLPGNNAVMKSLAEKSEYYGIPCRVQPDSAGKNPGCAFPVEYSHWSDLCVNSRGIMTAAPDGSPLAERAPGPESSFINDIWNSTELKTLRLRNITETFSSERLHIF